MSKLSNIETSVNQELRQRGGGKELQRDTSISKISARMDTSRRGSKEHSSNGESLYHKSYNT